MKRNTKTEIKMWISVCLIILLTIALAITTYALVMVTYVVKDENTYSTGTISINLNDGKPVIRENEFLFEPGVLVRKEFFIRNTGTGEAYYRLYFDNITGPGGLDEAIEVTVTNPEIVCTEPEHGELTSQKQHGPREIKGKVLYKGKLSELVDKDTADDYLKVGECYHMLRGLSALLPDPRSDRR